MAQGQRMTGPVRDRSQRKGGRRRAEHAAHTQKMVEEFGGAGSGRGGTRAGGIRTCSLSLSAALCTYLRHLRRSGWLQVALGGAAIGESRCQRHRRPPFPEGGIRKRRLTAEHLPHA